MKNLIEALKKIAEYDVSQKHGHVDEWNEAVAFNECKQIAQEVLKEIKMVVYIGNTGFFDGLTYGEKYIVINENESQYIVNNDLGGTSAIQKTKFE